MFKPQVSIIMATWNRAGFIGDMLTSIANQTFKDWECLIIDDGSTDNTEEAVAPYLNRDRRFNYLKREAKYKKGLSGCRNMGLDIAQGSYIIFFDDDDIAHPQNLEICLETLSQRPHAFCQYKIRPFYQEWNEKFECLSPQGPTIKIGVDQIPELLAYQINFSSCSVLWDIKCFDKVRFNEDLLFAEEWECYSRIIVKGFTGIGLDKFLYFNRKHSNSNTGQFAKNNPIQRLSKIKATKLVIANLKENKKLFPELKRYFIRIGFLLKDYSIISCTLNAYRADIVERLKYRMGFLCYPVLKEFFKLKKTQKG